MSQVDRFTRQGVGASDRPGFWVHASDFNQKTAQAQAQISELLNDLGALKGEYDRAMKKVDALQLRLTSTDQRLDELISAVRSINHAKHHEVLMPGDDEPRYWQRKEWVDWVLSLCDAAPATAAAESNCRQRLAAEGKPYPRSSCEVCGQFSPKSRECDAMLAAELNTPQ